MDALAELAGLLSDLVGPIDDIGSGLETTSDSFNEIASVAKAAATAIRDVRAALDLISASPEQRRTAAMINVKQHLGMLSAEEAWHQRAANGDKEAIAWENSGKSSPKAPAVGGAAPGGPDPKGVATRHGVHRRHRPGVAAGLPAVTSAGEAIARALDQGTRAAGEIHSPSQLAARTGAQFPAGTVQGIDSGRDDVAAAAARRWSRGLAPERLLSAPTASALPPPITIINQWPDGTTRRRPRETLEAIAEGAVHCARCARRSSRRGCRGARASSTRRASTISSRSTATAARASRRSRAAVSARSRSSTRRSRHPRRQHGAEAA